MKPILVLGPQPAGMPPLEQLQLVHRTALSGSAVADAAAYSAVLVIDDASAATIQRLLLALRLCRAPRARVGVLTCFDEAELRKAVAMPGPPADPGQPLHAAQRRDLLQRNARLRIGLDEGVLSVEYQAD